MKPGVAWTRVRYWKWPHPYRTVTRVASTQKAETTEPLGPHVPVRYMSDSRPPFVSLTWVEELGGGIAEGLVRPNGVVGVLPHQELAVQSGDLQGEGVTS